MKIKILILSISIYMVSSFAMADSCPNPFKSLQGWRIGAEVNGAFVPATNPFLRGENFLNKKIASSIAGGIHTDLGFKKDSREEFLYKGIYQGLGVQANSFFSNDLLGTPVSLYVYQGAPVFNFNSRLNLGYEWKFGAAFGWNHHKSNSDDNNAAISTSTTAHMGLAIKLNYQMTDRWDISFGITATHFSNGNTSLPNAGVNSIGASIGISCLVDPKDKESGSTPPEYLYADKDCSDWLFDIIAYGAFRKRALAVNDYPQLLPGKFGVAGIQFSPLRRLNQWIAVGPSLDIQYDESAGLSRYWVEGSYDESIRFYRPPFGKQMSAGISAHAELTTPVFTINAGLGYDFIKPDGDKRFYQSLTLKTFLTRHLFINVGYRLGNFKDPQNLMLGVGWRL